MWQCQQSGTCCERVREVVMTPAERDEIERAAPSGVVLTFVPHADARFTRLLAAPCPLLTGHQCAVYAVRPMNCRRWGCFRDDVTTEPFEDVPIPAAALKTRTNRRTLDRMQRKAATWGRSHGWFEDMH